MLGYINESEYNDYTNSDSIVNQHITSRVSCETPTLEESYKELEQKYYRLYAFCNNYYQNYHLSRE